MTSYASLHWYQLGPPGGPTLRPYGPYGTHPRPCGPPSTALWASFVGPSGLIRQPFGLHPAALQAASEDPRIKTITKKAFRLMARRPKP